MFQPNLPPKPPVIQRQPAPGALEQALGERQQVKNILQKRNASYPPPEAPGKKVFSGRPREVDL